LTSNRVEVFDEAFKSRIQLSLRYDKLDYDQRLQIWEILISRLESLQLSSASSASRSDSYLHTDGDLNIEVEEIEAYLPDLANAQMNGREIRNAISTARQLAMFRKEPMTSHHLQSVIKHARRFDNSYIE
jgi:hypothetical protein